MTDADETRVRVPQGFTAWPAARDWTDAWWVAWLRGKGWADDAIRGYLGERRGLSIIVAGGKGKTASQTVVYAPTPMGVRFHLATAPNLLYGGAAGGAKSYTARHDAYLRLLTMPGCRVLLLRRKYTELTDNHLNDAQKEVALMAGLGLPIRYLKDERRVVVTHPSGVESWVRFGHCEHDGDEDQYLSSEYEAIYPDEAATFLKKQVMGVASRLRTTMPGVRPVLRCTSNPGGAQTLWLKQWFIDKVVGPDEDADYDPAEWAFIQSRLYDNPYLMDADGTWRTYAKRLTPLGKDRAAQMLKGSWDIIAGQYFGEFSRAVHVQDVIVPPGTAYFRCLDWGYNNLGVCLWIACLPDGRLHVEHEYVFRQTIAVDVAAEILRQTALLGEIEVRYTVADPSMWNHSGQVGESIAETFAKAGVPMLRGSNERVIGWQRLRHWFRLAPDGHPWLTMSPSCAYLARTLPALVSDDLRPEDVDTAGDDHGGDTLRYGVMSRPAPTAKMVDLRLPTPGSVGALLADARLAAGRATVLGMGHVRRH